MDSIIVGVDGGEPSKQAASRAAAFARELGARLTLVMAVRNNQVETVESGGDHWLVSDLDLAEQRLREFADTLDAAVEVEVLALTGTPARAIVTAAERVGADLIVVGNRRMQGASRVLGSVGTDVLKAAPCDVLVVKTT